MSGSGEEGNLEATLRHHDLDLPAAQVAALDQYRRLLWQWNARMNLTRHLDLQAFVTRDVLDSAQLARHLNPGERVLDIGTGGGVPGVILAILRPDVTVAVCDSIGKKATAVAQIVDQLRLPVTVYGARAGDVLADNSFDTAVARAVGPLWKILKWLQPHWSHCGRLLLIKGPNWVSERGEARHRGLMETLQLRRLASYATPGHHGESVVLSIFPKSSPANQPSAWTGPEGTEEPHG